MKLCLERLDEGCSVPCSAFPTGPRLIFQQGGKMATSQKLSLNSLKLFRRNLGVEANFWAAAQLDDDGLSIMEILLRTAAIYKL